jgi:hypothetical protein
MEKWKFLILSKIETSYWYSKINCANPTRTTTFLFENLTVVNRVAYFYFSPCVARQTSALWGLLLSGFRNFIHRENNSIFWDMTPCIPLKGTQNSDNAGYLVDLFFSLKTYRRHILPKRDSLRNIWRCIPEVTGVRTTNLTFIYSNLKRPIEWVTSPIPPPTLRHTNNADTPACLWMDSNTPL